MENAVQVERPSDTCNLIGISGHSSSRLFLCHAARSSFRRVDYPSDRPGPCSCHSDLKRKKDLTRYLTKVNIETKNFDFTIIVGYFRSKNYLRNLTKDKNLRVLHSRHSVERNVTDGMRGRILKSGIKETRKCVWSSDPTQETYQ